MSPRAVEISRVQPLNLPPLRTLSSPLMASASPASPATVTGPQDRAVLSEGGPAGPAAGTPPAPLRLTPSWWSRVRQAARGLTLGIALGLAVLGGVGLVPGAGRDPAGTMLAHDHDLTEQERVGVAREVAGFDSSAARWLAERGVQVQITHGDAEVARMLERDGGLVQVDLVRLSGEAHRASALAETLAQDPELAALRLQHAELEKQHDQANQAYRQSLVDQGLLPPGALPVFGGLGGMMGMPSMSGMAGLPGGCPPAEPPTVAVDHVPTGGPGAGGLQAPGSQPPGYPAAPTGGPAAPTGGSAGAGHAGGLGGMFPMKPLPPPPPELLQLSQRLLENQQRQGQVMADRAKAAGLSGEWASSASFPISVNNAVLFSGARSPQEKAEFRALLEAANGPRLARARQDFLAGQQARIDKLDNPQLRTLAEQSLSYFREHPDDIPMDRMAHAILLPPLRYVQLEGGLTLRLPPDSEALKNIHAQGLHFGGKGLIQVDADQVGATHTLTHELGHALEDQLHRADPTFYGGWKSRLDQAYAQAKAAGSPSSQYGLTNPAEYIAEGIRLHYENPTLLRERDPKLGQLTAELLQKGHQMGQEPVSSALLLLGSGLSLLALGALRRSTPGA